MGTVFPVGGQYYKNYNVKLWKCIANLKRVNKI